MHAVATARLGLHLSAQAQAAGVDAAATVDARVTPMVVAMREAGLPASEADLVALADELSTREQEVRQALEAIVGSVETVHGSSCVGPLLYEELGVPVVKVTKKTGRPSTEDKVLEALRHRPEVVASGAGIVIQHVQDEREIRKLRTTYALPMRAALRHGRLHPDLRMTAVPTGRLSCIRPNLLATPKHSVLGKRIRAAFAPNVPRVFAAWDLSQIEMREMAHRSQDPLMIDQFTSGVDFHTQTACRLFRKTTVSDEERFGAKAINFGILMGITGVGLMEQFHKHGLYTMTAEACNDLISQWYRTYRGCLTYVEHKRAEARRYGYVTDGWGLRRTIPGIWAVDKKTRARAERQAQATPIQAGAQGLMKRAMIAVWEALPAWRQTYGDIQCLLQTHDELLFELPSVEVFHALDPRMKALFAAVGQREGYTIPILAKGTWGASWNAV
jgi:DNA polymerase-1